ncbi:MAG: M23 family metallopeptidase [Oscillospiraceae bacterium]|nr:M23 family metallopeptidase [Oscillospiraceae bacterium]
MSKNKFSKFVNGKGYYIALILFAVAIGVSGFLYYRSADADEPQMQQPSAQTDTQKENGVEAVATEPADQTPTTQPTQPAKKPAKTTNPLAGQTVATYSMEALAYNATTRDWRVHNGVDIAAEAGTKVLAAAEGKVYAVFEDDTMGMTVVIDHSGGYMTRYSSLAKEVSVKVGDTVSVGQTIGEVGNTALLETAIGDHLHFSVSCNGELIDPATFLPKA